MLIAALRKELLLQWRTRGQLMAVEITRAGSFTLYGDPAVVGME